MPKKENVKKKGFRLHHRGRLHQIPIFLGKQLRSFLYMNDWKMLPMAAVITALVSMVIRKYFFVTMEGTLMSAFALTCVCIWNGCFNSIQVICRERAIIKREHRSGMYISSYVISHMIYQALLCLGQTIVTLYVCSIVGIKFPVEGFMTPFLLVDIGITIFLVTYASDMLSLVASSISHTTTAAMTIMPFVLIFQLVFSGSIFTLPAWAEKISVFTISRYGLTAIAAQADYNSQPMNTGWTTLLKLENQQVEGTITLGQVLDLVQNGGGMAEKLRNHPITLYSPDWLPSQAEESIPSSQTDAPAALSVAEAVASEAPAASAAPVPEITTAPVASTALSLQPSVDLFDLTALQNTDLKTTPITVTVGELLDFVLQLPEDDSYRERAFSFSIRVGDVLDMLDREALKDRIITATTNAMYNSRYARTQSNIIKCWTALAGFSLIFALMSMILLKFIDKDKR